METKQAQVSESYRATLKCKYLGNSGRISVARYESNINGKDPQRITVTWDQGLSIGQNYREAVKEYLKRANWGGQWVTSTITDGAVAICIDAIDEMTK